jgi:hypothetical protein
VNQPTDQVIVSELPSYIRDDRVAINAVSGGGNVGTTILAIAGGTTQLVVGTDLGLFGYEVVEITGLAAVTLTKILGGVNGQVKVFIFGDTNLKLTDGPRSGGQLFLNQLPAFSDYSSAIGDVVALVNIGGNGGSLTGYWKELWRLIALK